MFFAVTLFQQTILLLYLNAFEGQFGLKEKMPESLSKAREYSAQIEEHIISSKIKPFQFPPTKTEPKTKNSTNIIQHPLTQNFDRMNTQFIQNQNQIMNRLTTLERCHHSSRPQFVRQQNVGWKPRP
jgi:hypothetical protein